MNTKLFFSITLLSSLLLSSCKKNVEGEYSGTASVTIGLATTTIENLYENGVRIAAVGTITASDNTVWTVPSETNFTNSSFPTASDLYNPDGNSRIYCWA